MRGLPTAVVVNSANLCIHSARMAQELRLYYI
eukprot:UN01849